MTGFLLTLLRLSLLGSVLGVVLMGMLHLLGRRISRAAGYYLWLLVLLRLCLPMWVDLPIPAHQNMAATTGVMVMTGQNTVTLPAAMTFMPFSGRKRRPAASRRNMTHRMAPASSFREK